MWFFFLIFATFVDSFIHSVFLSRFILFFVWFGLCVLCILFECGVAAACSFIIFSLSQYLFFFAVVVWTSHTRPIRWINTLYKCSSQICGAFILFVCTSAYVEKINKWTWRLTTIVTGCECGFLYRKLLPIDDQEAKTNQIVQNDEQMRAMHTT